MGTNGGSRSFVACERQIFEQERPPKFEWRSVVWVFGKQRELELVIRAYAMQSGTECVCLGYF